jgi:hypothetical protein
MRAQLFVNQMRRGRLHARSCRHDLFVDGPYRPSGRNAFPSGTPPSIMSPTTGTPRSSTEIRLSTRAHNRPNNQAHAPPEARLAVNDDCESRLDERREHR